MITLLALSDTYSIYKLSGNQKIPFQITSSGFYSVTKTEDEVSIITNCTADLEFMESSKGWKGFKVEGILDFSMTGILNDIILPLKESGISVFVISTFNTDYIFVKEAYFEKAIDIFKLTDHIRIKTNQTD